MFNLPCAACGHLEIFHADLKILLSNFRSGLWPDIEYLEEPDLRAYKTEEEFQAMLNQHLRGYEHKLFNRHSFRYRREDEKEVVRGFVENRNVDASPPRHLMRRISREIKRREEEEDRKLSGPWCPPAHIYIIGGRVYQGE